MPIESEVPLEIERYRKKIAFGLTARQLIGLAAGLALAGGGWWLFIYTLGLGADLGGWLVLACVAPALTVGFVRPREEPLERVLARRMRRLLDPQLLCYESRPGPALSGPGRGRQKDKGGTRHERISIPRGGENTYRYRPRASRRQRRRQTARRLRALGRVGA